ncbi:MAG: 3-isopropylmalate dehydrogenase [Acidimicrobiales bacterium]
MTTRAVHRVGVIGGDGIGPEVLGEALRAVEATGVKLDTVPFQLGADAYLRGGVILPDEVLEEIRDLDAILLGAIGPPIGSAEVPSGLLERGLLLRLRFELDLYVNLRPFATPVGSPPPAREGLDVVVVRENTEGPYAGEGGILRRGTPAEVATQGSVNTRHGVERCIRFAFEQARTRPRRHLTLVHKTNVLTYAGDLWSRTFAELEASYPDVSTAYNHVDAACIHLVQHPEVYDVVVTDNLFGDILTDLAGALSGGIGLAASANLNPARTGPSLFEPVHGAAHDIVGTGKANPLAAIRSAAMMLEFLGEAEPAAALDAAVTAVAADPGAAALGTAGIGAAVVGRL